MKRKLMLLLTCLFIGIGLVTAQVTKVTGLVISEEDGLPVVGASVLVKGTTVGTVTDMDGKFMLSNIPSSAKTIVVSFIGMQSQELHIKANMNITLKADAEVLEEVMVVAFGTAKKSAFTGSAGVVKADKIVARQTSNVTSALAGQVAGVQSTSSNGQPGEKTKIRIRGVGSLSASNEPLYVVDGIPYDGDISAINTQDIESMTVLKDAASNALYGARGANGVVLINTKKGQSGKASITLDAKWGTNRRAVPKYEMLTSPAEYYEMIYQSLYNVKFNGQNAAEANAFANSRIFGKNAQGGVGYQVYTIPEGESFIGMDGKVNPNATLGYNDGKFYYTPDDWYDEVFGGSNLRQEYNASISGMNDKINYYFSAGYLEDTGIIPNSGFQRYSTRLKADYQVTKWLKLSGNMSYNNLNSKYPGDQTSSASTGNVFAATDAVAPIYPLYVRDANGNIMKDARGWTVYDFGDNTNSERYFMSRSNPLAGVAMNKTQYKMDIIRGNWSAMFDILPGLRATANVGFDLDYTTLNLLNNKFYGQYADMGGYVFKSMTRTFSLNQQYLLTYNKTFNEKHTLDVLAGHESYNWKRSGMSGDKQKIYDPFSTELSNAIIMGSLSSSTDRYATEGWLGRIQYDYDGKYFGSVSYRRDASSRFHPDNRWGNFWSVGGAWLMSKESFMENVEWVDLLKVKASYGLQGNDNLLYKDGTTNYYPYADQFRISNNAGDFATALYFKGNKDITWEKSHSFNTGVDFELFKGRLTGAFEYFSRKTTDMLYYMPVSPSGGYAYVPKNVGSMINSGVELDLTGTIFQTKDINWSVNLNATHVKNEILELDKSLNGELITGSYIYREGESMYQMYLREYAGVDAATGEALYYKDVTDENGHVTGRETTADWANATRYAQGDMMPDIYGGFGTTLNAYGFDLSISFAYQLGGTIYDAAYANLMHCGDTYGLGTNFHTDIRRAWSPENTQTDVPRLCLSDKYANAASTRFLTSSDYLSLQNISVGYNLPKNWLRPLGIGSMRVYFVADNVALWSARKGLDPRQSYTTANVTYSAIRSLSGGLSLTF